jgi:hypothetical protein
LDYGTVSCAACCARCGTKCVEHTFRNRSLSIWIDLSVGLDNNIVPVFQQLIESLVICIAVAWCDINLFCCYQDMSYDVFIWCSSDIRVTVRWFCVQHWNKVVINNFICGRCARTLWDACLWLQRCSVIR